MTPSPARDAVIVALARGYDTVPAMMAVSNCTPGQIRAAVSELRGLGVIECSGTVPNGLRKPLSRWRRKYFDAQENPVWNSILQTMS